MPVVPIALGVMAAASAGTAIYQATNTPKAPNAPSTADIASQQARASEAAAMAQAKALKSRRGLASTILTSPLGTAGQPSVGRATLGN